MEILALVERDDKNSWQARSGEPMVMEAEGGSAEEALDRLRALLEARLQGGTRIVSLGVPGEETGADPWARTAGLFKDDPLFDEWQEAVRTYRAELDADPNVP